jgi:hypothetical protein
MDEMYKELVASLSKNDSAEFVKKHDLWLKQKNKVCTKYSSNDMELKTCHINFNIPKLNELWDIELKAETIKSKFEGKWVDCYGDKRELYCRDDFLMQQGDNICGTWGWIDTRAYFHGGNALFRSKNGKFADSVKVCNHRNVAGISDCSVDFSDWTDSSDESISWKQEFQKRPFHTSIKTPFLPGEREELIQTNKWLKDCLNYKGR